MLTDLITAAIVHAGDIPDVHPVAPPIPTAGRSPLSWCSGSSRPQAPPSPASAYSTFDAATATGAARRSCSASSSRSLPWCCSWACSCRGRSRGSDPLNQSPASPLLSAARTRTPPSPVQRGPRFDTPGPHLGVGQLELHKNVRKIPCTKTCTRGRVGRSRVTGGS